MFNKLVYNFCTYEVSIEFGSILLPQADGRTVVPLASSFVEGFAAVNIAP